jgi:Lar family restriction alleviation protein
VKGEKMSRTAFAFDTKKLKPCPFCGCDNLYIIDREENSGYESIGIFCNGCKQTVFLEENEWEGNNRITREKAIEAWNRRWKDGDAQ